MSPAIRSSFVVFVAFIGGALSTFAASPDLDREVQQALDQAGFTGRVQSTLEARLGRPVNPQLADLGRLLWFDKAGGLHSDNTCGGCHSPANGFGDSQSIAIGVQNNNLVGPNRSGPRNQRRTPTAANTAFYPNLMWNGRFSAPSGSPFDKLSAPVALTSDEFNNLVAFVRDALLDERAKSQNLCRLAPAAVPSGFTTMRFENCAQRRPRLLDAEPTALPRRPDSDAEAAP
jgi:cytochrome c peroxidase